MASPPPPRRQAFANPVAYDNTDRQFHRPGHRYTHRPGDCYTHCHRACYAHCHRDNRPDDHANRISYHHTDSQFHRHGDCYAYRHGDNRVAHRYGDWYTYCHRERYTYCHRDDNGNGHADHKADCHAHGLAHHDNRVRGHSSDQSDLGGLCRDRRGRHLHERGRELDCAAGDLQRYGDPV